MARPTRARVDLAAIRHNYAHAKAQAPGARALAVVKADAYGHGAVAVARALAPVADAFAVACTEEALELREAGITKPIVLLEGVFEPSELAHLDSARLTPVAHNREQLDWLCRARPTRPFQVWLKMDTGMHRLGMEPADFAAAHARLADCSHVSEIVLMTHLACADEPEHPATRAQLACFTAHAGGLPGPRSIANSAAVLGCPAAHGDWLRPGIMLYGATPFGEAHPSAAALRPTMQLQSQLISVRALDPGEAIGYGGRYVCQAPTRVGVVAAGYADGYPRHAKDGTPAAVNGKPSRVIGRVSMDMLTVDLTDQPDARPGDPVQLWGDAVPANDVAAASDTIAYQLFTGLSRRVPVSYRDDS
ncbi:alanine racemase [Thiohalocapsa halophila]|uniref:Alanine racemase n=1 Tax=Thiohalocapsa halophila TaxID=69359 RepID=A0ABS1CCD1_9GAMM|nr:alanine racemase [Thiohalocapsa halophila]MBK1629154.1 alanine racemase [Thiohalocapsa halophila]